MQYHNDKYGLLYYTGTILTCNAILLPVFNQQKNIVKVEICIFLMTKLQPLAKISHCQYNFFIDPTL